MSVQNAIDKRTEKLRSILAASNTALEEKNGAAAADLSGLPAAIATLGREETIWRDIIIVPSANGTQLSVPDGYGIRSVIVEGDSDFVPENIAENVTIFGVTGTAVIDRQLKTTAVDYSQWDNGSFTETLNDGTVLNYTVAFNEDGQPMSIVAPDGTAILISWEG